MFRTIAIICMIVGHIHAQNVQLFLKKGTAAIADRNLAAGQVVTLQESDILMVNPSALVLIKYQGAIAELAPGQQYKYNDLFKILKKKKSFTKVFAEVIINQQYSGKKYAGVTTRGNSADPWEYAPQDSVQVLGDSMTLQAGNSPLRLLSDISLYRIGTKDTITLSKTSLQHRIPVPAPGKYCWEYKAKVLNKSLQYENCFFVPEMQEGKNLFKQYKAYEKSIAEFSPEMRELLMEEYCEMNGVYVR
jgi:hypothetical protein